MLEEKTNAEVYNDFEKISLSNMSYKRPELLASDVGYQLVSRVKHDGCWILAIDESIEITDVAKLNVFI